MKIVTLQICLHLIFGLCCHIDAISQSYSWVVKPKFDQIYDLLHGQAIVKKDEKWGMINEAGEEIISIQYEEIGRFFQGLSKVRKANKHGYIDKNEKEVIPIIYDRIEHYRATSYFSVQLNGKRGIINSQHNNLLPTEYTKLYPVFRKDGPAFFVAKAPTGQWGIISSQSWDWVVLPIYELIENHLSGYYLIQQNGKWGILDQRGKVLLKPKSDDKPTFSIGYFTWKENDQMGLLVLGSKRVISPGYESISRLTDQYYKFKIEGQWGIIDTVGQEVLPASYSSINSFDRKSLFIVKDQFLAGILNTSGDVILPFQYDQINTIASGSKTGVRGTSIQQNDQFGFINSDGEVLVQPRFEQVRPTSFYLNRQQHFRVRLKSLWGVFDLETNELVIPLAYSSAFDDELLNMEKQLWKELKRNGKNDYQPSKLIEAPYRVTVKKELQSFPDTSKKLVPYEVNGKWGFYDADGSTMVTPTFDQVLHQENGVIPVKMDGQWGLIKIPGFNERRLPQDILKKLANDFSDTQQCRDAQTLLVSAMQQRLMVEKEQYLRSLIILAAGDISQMLHWIDKTDGGRNIVIKAQEETNHVLSHPFQFEYFGEE